MLSMVHKPFLSLQLYETLYLDENLCSSVVSEHVDEPLEYEFLKQDGCIDYSIFSSSYEHYR